MAVKQYFIPAHIAGQIISVDAAESEKVKATVNGDYVAIAGVKADRISRVFNEADPDNPNMPLFEVTEAAGIYADTPEIEINTLLTSLDATLSSAGSRTGTLWEVIDPAAPMVVLASSGDENWRYPDTGAGDRTVKLTLTYTDPYSGRTLTTSISALVAANDDAPKWSGAPSIAGTGVIGSTGTITPGTVTGDPAPTVKYQVYVDGVASGDPFSGTTFTFSEAGAIYTIAGVAENSHGTVASAQSNAITTADASLTPPS